MVKTLNVLFYLLIFTCIASFGGYIWLRNNKDNFQAIITNYMGINTQVNEIDKDLDSDVIYTYVIDYYANRDNSGMEMLEIKQTTYTDYRMQGVYSAGVQILNPSALELDFVQTGRELNIFAYERVYYTYRYKNVDSVEYFNSVDGICFAGTDKLTSLNDDLYIIDIHGKPYAFNYMKTIQAYHSQSLWISQESYVTSNFDYFMSQIYNVAKSFVKEGIYTELPIKLSDVFNVFEYNSETGKFDIQSTFGQIDSYMSFKFNIYDRGVMTHEDSLFGRIGTEYNKGVIWG